MGATVADATPRDHQVSASTVFMRSVAPRLLGANLVAALVVYLYLSLVAPPMSSTEASFTLELATFGGYIALAAAVGFQIGKRSFAPVARWLDPGRTPSEKELETTLEQPLRLARWVFTGWGVGAVAFARSI